MSESTLDLSRLTREDLAKDPQDDESAALESVGPAPGFGRRRVQNFRIAHCLDVLRSQVNSLAPQRRKDSDGWIGDSEHASRDSDHNPHVMDGEVGVVTALDVTHDPERGCDTYAIAEAIRTSRDSRVKYVISDRRMFASYDHERGPAWTWRQYSGPNPHTSHVHVSVVALKNGYDSPQQWAIAT